MKYWLKVITANPNRYTSRASYVLLQDVVNGAAGFITFAIDDYAEGRYFLLFNFILNSCKLASSYIYII